MFWRRIYFMSIILICFCIRVSSQSPTLDSLKNEVKNAKHDTVKFDLYSAMCDLEGDQRVWGEFNNEMLKLCDKNLKLLSKTDPAYNRFLIRYSSALNNAGYLAQVRSDNPAALIYYNKSLEIKKVLGDITGQATVYGNMAYVYYFEGNNEKALNLFSRSKYLYEKAGDQTGVASCLNNIGLIYDDQGQTIKALELYSACLKIKESLNDKQGIAFSIHNIATVHTKQGHPEKALEYFTKSLALYTELKDQIGIHSSYMAVGGIYADQKMYDKALEQYMKAYAIQKELNDKRGMANGLSSIGKIFKLQGNNHKAMEFYKRSLELREEVKDQSGIAISLNQLSSILIEENKHAEAQQASQRALDISLKLGHIDNIKTSAFRLSQIYKHKGNAKAALENFELYIKMRDSSNNEITKKASLKAQLKYEYEKQAAADSVAHAKESEIKNAELAKQNAEIKAKKNQQYALFGGLFCVCVFGVFMFNRYKVTQKQKGIIEKQKEVVEKQKKLVEVKQKEILDSIRYAKRIQLAQIPSEKSFASKLSRLQKQ